MGGWTRCPGCTLSPSAPQRRYRSSGERRFAGRATAGSCTACTRSQRTTSVTGGASKGSAPVTTGRSSCSVGVPHGRTGPAGPTRTTPWPSPSGRRTSWRARVRWSRTWPPCGPATWWTRRSDPRRRSVGPRSTSRAGSADPSALSSTAWRTWTPSSAPPGSPLTRHVPPPRPAPVSGASATHGGSCRAAATGSTHVPRPGCGFSSSGPGCPNRARSARSARQVDGSWPGSTWAGRSSDSGASTTVPVISIRGRSGRTSDDTTASAKRAGSCSRSTATRWGDRTRSSVRWLPFWPSGATSDRTHAHSLLGPGPRCHDWDRRHPSRLRPRPFGPRREGPPGPRGGRAGERAGRARRGQRTRRAAAGSRGTAPGCRIAASASTPSTSRGPGRTTRPSASTAQTGRSGRPAAARASATTSA